MMQQEIFQSTFLRSGFNYLAKEVLFSESCISQFLKAIAFFHKKVTTFNLVNENQHFISQNVGFLFLWQINSKNQYLWQ